MMTSLNITKQEIWYSPICIMKLCARFLKLNWSSLHVICPFQKLFFLKYTYEQYEKTSTLHLKKNCRLKVNFRKNQLEMDFRYISAFWVELNWLSWTQFNFSKLYWRLLAWLSSTYLYMVWVCIGYNINLI